MSRLPLFSGIITLLLSSQALAFTMEPALRDDDGPPNHPWRCMLQNYNTCSGWVWVFGDREGSVWGAVLDPMDCPGGCPGGGNIEDIWFWGYCEPDAPAQMGEIGICFVDAIGCPTACIWQSPPLTVYSCISGDRWTHLRVPCQSLDGMPVAITFRWGPESPAMRLATDNGLANLFCWLGAVETFPGCASTDLTCTDWCCPLPPQSTYIYVTDFNGDTVLDDLCAIYGYPYPLDRPYVLHYGYVPNNLMVVLNMNCDSHTPVENTSWGHVKALYE